MNRDSHAARIWPKVCHHLNGMALAGTAHTLKHSGVLAAWAEEGEPPALDELAWQCRLSPAYLALGARLLASQGLVVLEDNRAALSPLGRQWRIADLPYGLAVQALEAAHGFSVWLQGDGPDQAGFWRPLLQVGEPGSKEGWAAEGLRHIQGALVAAVMRGFSLHRLWETLVEAGTRGLDPAGLGLNPAALEAAFTLLAAQGWAWTASGRAGLTGEGRLLPDYAPQYFAPLSYLPTFRAAPDFLSGDMVPDQLGRDAAGRESHLDRELDIEFSGLVFRRGCAKPFLEAVLPVFNEPLDQQPACVLDTGCGDATLLIELYRAVAQGTLRGSHLEDHPLIMAGVEYNSEARRVAEARLAQAGVPHLVLPGDIADPQSLAQDLRQRGLDPEEVLHVNKSVVHNRAPRLPQAAAPWDGLPGAAALAVSRQGELIAPEVMTRELVDFFRRWLPHTARHGMVVIEAHTVDPAVAAPHRHRHLLTCTDAYHVLSGQYLVEAETHRWAYGKAGFRASYQADLGRAVVGRTLMSVDYLRPA